MNDLDLLLLFGVGVDAATGATSSDGARGAHVLTFRDSQAIGPCGATWVIGSIRNGSVSGSDGCLWNVVVLSPMSLL